MFCLKKTRRTHSTKSVWTVCMFPFLSGIVFNLSLRTFLKQKRLEIRLVEQPFSSEIFYVNLVRFDDFKLAKYIVTFTTRTKKTAKSEHVQKLELQICTLLGTIPGISTWGDSEIGATWWMEPEYPEFGRDFKMKQGFFHHFWHWTPKISWFDCENCLPGSHCLKAASIETLNDETNKRFKALVTSHVAGWRWELKQTLIT